MGRGAKPEQIIPEKSTKNHTQIIPPRRKHNKHNPAVNSAPKQTWFSLFVVCVCVFFFVGWFVVTATTLGHNPTYTAISSRISVFPKMFPWFEIDTLPETNSSDLKMGGWMMAEILVSLAYFPGRTGCWFQGEYYCNKWSSDKKMIHHPFLQGRIPVPSFVVVHSCKNHWTLQWRGLNLYSRDG